LERKPGQGMLEVSNIRALNLAVGCLLPGDEVVIGAETSFGKTALAMHFVAHLCFGAQRKKVAIYSMEMRKQSIWERVFAAMAEVPLENIRRNDLDQIQLGKIENLIQTVPKGHYVFMDDNPTLDIRSIVSRCRRLKKKHGLDAVVVDYLQLVSPANLKATANRQQEVADISRRLKMLAVELDVVVIALSQLNEAGQLRESRAIGQDADIVMSIVEGDNRDSTDKKIVITKNRNGPKGDPITIKFQPKFVSFGNGMKLDTPEFL
jgi:replicative DNA helicase